MKYSVSFQYSTTTYCSNIAIAENREAVEAYYSKYEWYSIKEATDAEIEEAQRKGKPFITIEPQQTEEQPEEKPASRYEELTARALEILEDDEIFTQAIEELDSWNGFLDDERMYNMDDLDDLFCGCKVSEFAEKIGRNFDFRDNYIIFTIYGIESTDETPSEHYRDLYDNGEILDNLREYNGRINIEWIDSELAEILDKLDEIQEAIEA